MSFGQTVFWTRCRIVTIVARNTAGCLDVRVWTLSQSSLILQERYSSLYRDAVLASHVFTCAFGPCSYDSFFVGDFQVNPKGLRAYKAWRTARLARTEARVPQQPSSPTPENVQNEGTHQQSEEEEKGDEALHSDYD